MLVLSHSQALAVLLRVGHSLACACVCSLSIVRAINVSDSGPCSDLFFENREFNV